MTTAYFDHGQPPKPSNHIRLMVVEDQHITRKTLCDNLAMEPGLSVVADAGDDQTALALLTRTSVDVILLDMLMDGSLQQGPTLLGALLAVQPTARVVVLSGYADDQLIVDAMTAGAVAYVPKARFWQDMLLAIEYAAKGQHYVDRATLDRLYTLPFAGNLDRNPPSNLLDRLSAREQEVLALLRRNYSRNDIAAALFIAPDTVRTHTENIYSKLGVHKREQLPLVLARLTRPRY